MHPALVAAASAAVWGWHSRYLYIHGIIAGILAYLLSGLWSLIWVPLAIAAAHIVIDVSTSKSMVKCKINVDTDFTDYTDFHNHYQTV
ncbi:MAG: hypothetical protein GQ533_02085 [Methanosarcinaceae archaeon]|nr:hypothetical protein [Methanosarcinaceae archaeon]